MQTTAIILSFLIVGIIIMFYVGRLRLRNIPLVASHEKIMTLTDKNFQHQTSNKTVLVDFWASWCAPCRMMAPILNEVAEEIPGNRYIAKVDIEQYNSLAQKYNVRNIPTLILFKNGVEVNRFVGIKNKEFLVKQMQNV